MIQADWGKELFLLLAFFLIFAPKKVWMQFCDQWDYTKRLRDCKRAFVYCIRVVGSFTLKSFF